MISSGPKAKKIVVSRWLLFVRSNLSIPNSGVIIFRCNLINNYVFFNLWLLINVSKLYFLSQWILPNLRNFWCKLVKSSEKYYKFGKFNEKIYVDTTINIHMNVNDFICLWKQKISVIWKQSDQFKLKWIIGNSKKILINK